MGSKDYMAIRSKWKFPNFERYIVIMLQNVLVSKKYTLKYLGR